jgi:hypothetical protein
MKQAATRELFSYWDALRARIDRAFLDAAPHETRALLASTFLIEVDARRAYPMRVVGGTLARLTASARLGASFLECWEPGSRYLLEAMLRAVHDENVPVVIGAVAREAGAAQAVEILLLPLAGAPGGPQRILGGLAPIGPLQRRGNPAPLEMISARAIRKPPASQPLALRAGSTAPRPAAPQSAAGARKPAPRLRLIQGGRSDCAQV